jgi:hypothetical protein
MLKSKLAFAVLAGVAAVAVAGGTAAIAKNAMSGKSNNTHDDHQGTVVPAAATTSSEPAVFFAAALNGRNEVPVAGGPATGDKDGQAVGLLRIQGSQLTFAAKWNQIGTPTAAHIHAGKPGTNGAIQVPLFGAGLADGITAVTGTVTITDKALLDKLKADPTGFYVNLHTAEFPGGAVRGQMSAVIKAIDLTSVLRGGPYASVLSGDQEVPAAGKVVGDPDGRATAFVSAAGKSVTYSVSWSSVGAPVNGHLHQGAVGTNGAVAVPLFAAPNGLPASITGVAGKVDNVNADLVKQISTDTRGFYFNLHTTDFKDGAVRGQLFRSGIGFDDVFEQSSFVASVTRGEQIYACTKQADGSFAFTQHNVSAVLQGGIAHSFVKDAAGPPQWISRDRSAVTGKLLNKTPNGDGNIPSLELELTQTGAPVGQFANAVEVLRLNTVGGVAPAGACDPQRQPIAKVPYQADYLFITK